LALSLALSLVVSLQSSPTALAVPQLDAHQPITVDAASGDYEYAKDHLSIRHVHIAQGQLAVSADDSAGSALQFEDSHWQFTGHVVFTSPDGTLASDSATVVFLHNQLVSITAQGAPAVFTGAHAGKNVRGHAERILYEPVNGTVKLTGDASLNDGDNEIKGQLLSYNFNERHLSAGPNEQKDQRITITITPKSKPATEPHP
jgi:lipopolysaccharide transport protein LptA